MKYAIVILDGAAGLPLDVFGGLTTLEKARTPHLDALAQAGTCGLSMNVPDGMEPSSNVACLSILGYSPATYDIGRGAIEGASLGVELEPGDVALRVNLCCVEDGCMKSYSAGNITTDESHALAEQLKAALDDDVFDLTLGTTFRHILRVKGHPELMDLAYSPAHNIADKPIDGQQPRVTDACEDVAHLEAAALLGDWMQRADAILQTSSVNARRVKEGELPATNAWAFWPGMKPQGMESFEKVYGHRAGMLSPVDLLNGLAQLTGMKRYHVPGLTDGLGNDYAAQGREAVRMLDEQDVVIVHIEAPDTFGHDGEPELKVEAIEAIDAEIVSRLEDFAKDHELRILALPDHPTPVAVKTHVAAPIPFVMAGPGIEVTAGSRLTEREAAISKIMIDPGCSMMARLLA